MQAKYIMQWCNSSSIRRTSHPILSWFLVQIKTCEIQVAHRQQEWLTSPSGVCELIHTGRNATGCLSISLVGDNDLTELVGSIIGCFVFTWAHIKSTSLWTNCWHIRCFKGASNIYIFFYFVSPQEITCTFREYVYNCEYS